MASQPSSMRNFENLAVRRSWDSHKAAPLRRWWRAQLGQLEPEEQQQQVVGVVGIPPGDLLDAAQSVDDRVRVNAQDLGAPRQQKLSIALDISEGP